MLQTVRTAVALLAAAILLIVVFPATTFAHKEYVHQYLAIEAYRLLASRYPGLASGEMALHIGEQTGGCGGFPFTQATVTAGAYREDCEDPVYHYGDVAGALDDAYFSASHFWDADAGDGSTIGICDVSCGDYQNAYQKTLRYVLPVHYGKWTAKLTWPAGVSSFALQGGGTVTIAHSGLIGFEYDSLGPFARTGACTITGFLDITGKWQSAATVPDQLPRKIVAPKNVRERIGWEVVGRIAHLLGDMGVPAHAHNDIHPPFWWNNDPADVYEEEMSRLYTAWDHGDALAQGGVLDLRSSLLPGSTERVMRYLLYTTNQLADRFPSNDADGDLVYDTAWNGDDYSVLTMIEGIDVDPGERNVFHHETAEVVFVYSIRSIAGLLDWFARETGLLAEVTAEASFPGASILVDGKPRLSPVRATYVAGSPFTLEALDQPGFDSVTGSWFTMAFNGWTRKTPGLPDAFPAGRRIGELAVNGSSYIASFSRVVSITLAEARHFDGGSGGRYSVDGVDVGAAWSGSINTGGSPGVLVGWSPPAGSVFVGWSDGATSNPRTMLPANTVTVRAFAKRRLSSTVAPGGRPANQRRLALSASSGAPAPYAAVMAYESAGEIFVATSVDGLAWSSEELVSDGTGVSRDPAISEYAITDGVLTAVAWEERKPSGGPRTVVARLRERGTSGWRPRIVLSHDSSGSAPRSTPSLSGEMAVWRGREGLVAAWLSGTVPTSAPGPDAPYTTLAVPATGPLSSSPVVDFYSPSGGRFAIAWVEAGSSVKLVRGTLPGPAWGAVREAGTAGAGVELRAVDLAMAATGSGGVAWTAAAANDVSLHYRTFDAAEAFQPVVPASGCPSGSGETVLRLLHHRSDPSMPRDIGLHAWTTPWGVITTTMLRSSQRIGPASVRIEGSYPELPAAAVTASVPAIVTMAGSDGAWKLIPVIVPAAPSLPLAPAPLSPLPGAAGQGASVTLAWSCATDALSYRVQLSVNDSFGGTLAFDKGSITAPSVSVDKLSPATTYYWRISAVNSIGSGPFSAPRSFTTSPSPAAPALSGAVVTTPKGPAPRLRWTAVGGAEAYRLYRAVCTDPSDCGTAAARPTAVYEGASLEYTDGSMVVSPKFSTGTAMYYVTARAGGFTGSASNTVSFPVQTAVISAETAPVPTTSGLDGNYPNPFNPSTTLAWRLSEPSRVVVTAWNVIGQPVATIVEGSYGAGFHEAAWDASRHPSGVYIVTMQATPVAGGRVVTDRRKIMYVR